MQSMREYLRLAYERETIAVGRNGARRRLVKMLRFAARWRLRRHFYDLPLEIWVHNAARQLRRSIEDFRYEAAESGGYH
ncbi:MAG: hypothetical protein V3V49_12155 [Candidatus Krumholzibacteria bacterium]